MTTFSKELDFQRHVEILADEHGWEIRHIPDGAYEASAYARAYIPAGIPDLELRYYKAGQDDPIVMLAELKMDGKELRPRQRSYLETWSHIVPCFVWRPANVRWIEGILKFGPPQHTGFIMEEATSPLLGSDPLVADETKSAAIRNFISGTRLQRSLPDDAADLRRDDVEAIVDGFIRSIRRAGFSAGDLAELRRMNPDSPGTTAAYWRLMAEENLLGNPIAEQNWALILHGIALMTPKSGAESDSRTAHDREMPIGRALYLGGDPNRGERGYYSELRLNRLLTARGSMLRTLLARMFRMMAAASQPFNWHDMAWLILNEDSKERFENSLRSIASAYFQAAPRSSQSENE